MKLLLIIATIVFSSSLFADMQARDWRYAEYYPSGTNMRYDAWTQNAGMSSFVTSCDVNHRRGDPVLSFFITTTTPIHTGGESVLATITIGEESFDIKSKVSMVNVGNLYMYPDRQDVSHIISLMRNGRKLRVTIPSATAGVYKSTKEFSLMGFNEASLLVSKMCKF